MLSRRALRVKIMQALYAYLQCKESNIQIAREDIKKRFSKDMNSMEPQDLSLLEKQRTQAFAVFDEIIHNLDKEYNGKVTDAEILEAVPRQIESYRANLNKDLKFLKNQMLVEVESIEKSFYLILMLPVLFSHIAEEIKNPRISYRNLVKNLLISKIKYDKNFSSLILKLKLNWDDDLDQVKGWFFRIIRDEKVIDYLSVDEPDFETDHEIIKYILRSLVLQDEVIDSYFEERDLFWVENKVIIRSLVKKMLKDISREEEELKITEVSINWEEDKEFFETLFMKTVESFEEHEKQVSGYLKNWDIDRIALVDKIILNMALTELKNFASIPVKVTINEYIEISKLYSSPKSKQFINGVLDVMAKNLMEEGLIKKSGRGLLDNK